MRNAFALTHFVIPSVLLPNKNLVTRGRIELPFAAWEAAVLAAWPTGHNSKTFGLCSLKVSPVRSSLTSQASFLVHHHGLEPWTHCLRVSCSTNWANGAYFSSRRKVCKRSFIERFRAASFRFSLLENPWRFTPSKLNNLTRNRYSSSRLHLIL